MFRLADEHAGLRTLTREIATKQIAPRAAEVDDSSDSPATRFARSSPPTYTRCAFRSGTASPTVTTSRCHWAYAGVARPRLIMPCGSRTYLRAAPWSNSA